VLVKADNQYGGNFALIPRFTIAYASTGLVHLGGIDLTQAGVWYQYEVIVNRSGRLQMWCRPKAARQR